MKKFLYISLVASALISAELPDYELDTFLGKVHTNSSTNLKDDYGFGVGLSKKVTDDLAIKLSYFKSNVDYKDGLNDTESVTYSLAPEYYFNSVSDVLVPYVSAGVGYIDFADNLYDAKNGFTVNYGVGLKYIISEYISLKLEAKHNYNIGEANSQFQYMAGIAVPFYLNDKPAPKPTPKPAPAPAPVKPTLMDPDSDGDGVIDRLDRCPNTPKGVSVDKVGCPLDSDGDGVPDYLDKCPGTPKGFKVDKVGCELSFTFYTKFAYDSFVLDQPSLDSVKSFSDFLNDNKGYKAKIEGHTDSKGSDKYNQVLSEKRAKAVYDALLKYGIAPNRLSFIGYGEVKPIADNNTDDGRAKNRRVEGTLIK